MAKLYALVGATTGEICTYLGQYIVHGDKSEMEYLFPNNRVVEFRPGNSDRVTWLKNLPSMEPVRFPLNKSDFR